MKTKNNQITKTYQMMLLIIPMLCGQAVAQEVAPDTKEALREAAATPDVVAELKEPDGASFQWTEDGGWRLFAIGTASYDFNDASDIADATQSAMLEAKAHLARFMKERLSTDLVKNKITEKKRVLATGSGKNVTKEEIETTINTIRNSADALLRGVIVLETNKVPEGDEGGTVTVKVVVSSKSQAAAERIAREISAPGGAGSTGSGTSPSGTNKGETRRSKSDY
jgi:hypothetical protein